MEDVKSVISDIKDNLHQKSASQKDEIRVMKAMLNDKSYEVGMYDKHGLIGNYSPYKESRKMISNIISSTTKISSAEADALADSYEVTTNDAKTMIGISKEFINTYLDTDRKLPLGGRRMMNVSLSMKRIEEKMKGVPSQMSNSERKTTTVPAHNVIKATSPCPSWLKG